MPATVFGLPTHALIVHLAVVLLPVSALVAAAWVVVPRWRPRLDLTVLALAVGSAVVAWATAEAGEGLEDRVRPSKLLEAHTELGDQMKVVAALFAIVVVATVLVDRRNRRSSRPAGDGADPPARAGGALRAVSLVLAAATLAGAVASTVWVVRTGHSGARAVWQKAAQANPHQN